MTTRLLTLPALLLLVFAGLSGAQGQDPESIPAGPAGDEPSAEGPSADRTSADEPADDAPDPDALLSRALLGLRNRRDMVVLAHIEHKDPPQGGGVVVGRAGAVVIRALGGPSIGKTFEGSVEAWRDPDGETVVISTRPLPGFALLVGRTRAVKQVTYEDAPPSFSQIEAELVPLLDMNRFLGHVMNAKLTHGRDPKTGDHLFRGPIGKDVVDPLRAPAGVFFPMARVLRCELRLRVTPEGAIKDTEITVVRNDPMAEIRARGGIRVVVQGGQQPQRQEKLKHDIEGGSTVYRLTYGLAKPNERATGFKRRIQRLLGEQAAAAESAGGEESEPG